MAYWESNDHVPDDVTWPWKVKFVTPKSRQQLAMLLSNSCLLLDSLLTVLWGTYGRLFSDSLSSCFRY